jgi:hypothetical protein
VLGAFGGSSRGISSTTGQPLKSLSLEEMELSELGSLTGRPALLMKGSLYEICFPGCASTMRLPSSTTSLPSSTTSLPLFSGGAELSGWAFKGGGLVLGGDASKASWEGLGRTHLRG